MQIKKIPAKIAARTSPKKTLVFITVVIVTMLLLFLSDQLATASLDKQRNQLHQNQAQLLQAVNMVPSPMGMTPGEPNSQARYIINTSVTATETATQATAELRYSLAHQLTAGLSRSHSAADMRRTNRQARELAPSVTDTLQRYGDLLAAMGEFIEYSPAVDTAGLSLGSADSNERMERLRRGLIRASAGVREADTQDSITDSVLSIIASAQTAQTELETNGDTAKFIATFELLQAEYVEHIDAYYQEVWPKLRRQAIEIARYI